MKLCYKTIGAYLRCELSNNGERGRFGEHSTSESCFWPLPGATFTLFSRSQNFLGAPYLKSARLTA